MARFVAVVTQTYSDWLRSEIYIATKKLHIEGLYKDSSCWVPNGWVRRYYTNGNLSSESRYTDGMIDGPFVTYHYNGMIHDSSFYVKGSIAGTFKCWHSNGYIADSAVYDNKGQCVQVFWFDNGMPSASGKKDHGL